MIKVGILGTGFGKFHGELYKKIDGFEIISIFGRNIDKLKQTGKELNVHTTSNIDEIIQNPDIDLLDICLPSELHSKWAIEGLKNNKHVFCETPLTFDPNEAEEIKLASLKYKKNVFVDMFYKFSTPHYEAEKYVKEDNLGKLINIRSYNCTSPRWGDLGLKKNIETFHIHNIDFVCGIIGMPENVNSSGFDFCGKSIVTTTFNVGNIYAVLESNSSLPDCSPFSIGFELIFTNGIICYEAKYGEYTKEEFIVSRNGGPVENLKLDMKDDFEEVFKHVKECIKGGSKSEILDVDVAVNTVKVKEKILKSIGLK